MVRHSGHMLLLLTAGFIALRCGNNINNPSSSSLGAPQNLQALSYNDTTVALRWSTPAIGADSSLRGYTIQYGAVTDTVPKGTLSFLAAPLGPAQTLFKVMARDQQGNLSDAASIQWAPAARFDSAFVIFEYSLQSPDRVAGMHLGDVSTDPSPMALSDVNAETNMDVYLLGESGQPLELRSANLYLGSWNTTLFSTQSDASQTLNLYLSAFPSGGTFTQSSFAIDDNTIYYAVVERQLSQSVPKYFARIQIHMLGGSFPDRSIAVRISLQRTAGLSFACAGMDRDMRSWGLLALLIAAH